MPKHLEKELAELKVSMLNMVAEVKQNLQKACQAFAHLDADLAQAVIEADLQINELEVSIDEQVLKLLALEAPVAKDLRFILGCLRSTVDLERIGDECANIAESTVVLSCKPSLPFYRKMVDLGEQAYNMLDLAVTAFFQPDADLAIEVCKMDQKVDDLNREIIREIINYMTEKTPAIERSVQAISICRRFERIADLSTNIAESAVFIDKGINIKHYCQFDNR